MIVYNFFKNLILNTQYTRLIKKAYRDEHILEGFSKLFGAPFHMDWIGRAYAVINPNLDEKGNYSPNTQIFEYDENGLNNKNMVEGWVMSKMIAASEFIRANNLFDILTYNIERLDEYDNYLFVLQPITLKDCLKWSKWMVGLVTFLILAVIATLIII